MAVARELTKLHEEIIRGSVSELMKYYSRKEPKGEITLVISGKLTEGVWQESRLLEEIQKRLETGQSSPSRLAKSLAVESGWSRRDIYNLIRGTQDEK
jgi:16S rRNA (cytidine1402-2'-O)-methyltransferase